MGRRLSIWNVGRQDFLRASASLRFKSVSFGNCEHGGWMLTIRPVPVPIMTPTLKVINQMQADGIIRKCAIGGAVGATFYLEPSATLDIDVFVSLQKATVSSLLTLTPLYDYLAKRGFKSEGEYIVIEGWQVQFLPPADALGEEALAQAIETEVEGVKTWVMTAEHLVAIALQTG